MSKGKTHEAVRGREDLSRFIVHLTRDDRKTFRDGRSARKNLLAILKQKRLLAAQAHCLHGKKIDRLPDSLQDSTKVVCLTEVPLNQLHLMVRKIPGRLVNLEPYGVVFTKEFVTAAGAQPALYINAYQSNWLREAADQLFACAAAGEPAYDKLWRFLPFINIMHGKYDFSWEREWRVIGDLKFEQKDLVCVILPEEGEVKLKEAASRAGVATISPGWSYEQIVGELARQQRATKRLVVPG